MTNEIERFENLIDAASDEWACYYDYVERYGANSTCAELCLSSACAYIAALEMVTGYEWYYDSDSEMVEPA